MSHKLNVLFAPAMIGIDHFDDDWGYENRLENCIEDAEAFAATTYNGIYIIDHLNKKFPYVSDNKIFLCGNTAKGVQRMGFEFYEKYVPRDDMLMLQDVIQSASEFYQSIEDKYKRDYTLSCDFNLIQKNNHRLLINHKLRPLIFDSSFKIRLSLCVVSLSPNTQSGNTIMQNVKNGLTFHYNFENNLWEKQSQINLTKIQKEVLVLSNQGLTLNDIAALLKKTQSTIAFHRKNILRKLKARNITEAIAQAFNYKLI